MAEKKLPFLHCGVLLVAPRVIVELSREGGAIICVEFVVHQRECRRHKRDRYQQSIGSNEILGGWSCGITRQAF